jgi:hypothetical protein
MLLLLPNFILKPGIFLTPLKASQKLVCSNTEDIREIWAVIEYGEFEPEPAPAIYD